MKNSILLIIGFTHIVFCCHLNVTDDPYPACPLKLFRRKRALTDYTRWRANIETTPEFIVKILDEEPLAPKKKKIVAVNIQPITKGVEKIIIGGAMVTLPMSKTLPVSTILDQETLKDYTRFVPPTTVATRADEGDFYLAPVQPVPSPHQGKPNSRARNPQRDESPPAAPQFLPHSPIAGARQYAPITPVGFTRHTTVAPLTPPSTIIDNFRKSNKFVRTTSSNDNDNPTRTTFEYEDFGNYVPYMETSETSFATRTTFDPEFEPERTVDEFQISSSTDSVDILPTSERADDRYEDEKKNDDKDSDAAYGMMFYSYDENEGGTKKTTNGNVKKKSQIESSEVYDDKLKDKEERQVEDTALTEAKDKSDKPSAGLSDEDNNISDIREDNKEIIETQSTSTSTLKVTRTSTPLIDIPTKTSIKEILRSKRRRVCNMVNLRDLNFNSPRTLPEIEAKLKQWAEESPVAKWVDITDGNLTAMERPIYMMIVDDPSSGQVISAKETVMIVAGIQGRDQHAVAAAMYVLYQLIERSESHTDLLTKYRFWIIPVFNPDGYDYAMTFPHRREWTKNLRQNWEICKGRENCLNCETYGLRCTIQPCYGVNLDRNFEYQWIPAEELRTEHPCGSLYAGMRQLSEAETSAFTKYLHNQHRPLFSFLAFKEGDVLGVMYPYSHTRKKRAFEHIYKQRASRAAAAAYAISGRPYVAGQTSDFLPLYAGGIEDWVDGHLGVDNTYTIMMFRPTDTYNSKFITERVVHEAYAAMDTLLLQSVEHPAGMAQVTVARTGRSSTALTATVSLTLLAFVIFVHIMCDLITSLEIHDMIYIDIF